MSFNDHNSGFTPAGVFDLETYYKQSSEWAEDRASSARRSFRIVAIVAGVAATIAALEAIALFTLMPLKTAVPYVVTVDRQSGYVETAQRLLPGGNIQQKDAVIQSMLAQYVLARESFDATDLAEQYRRVQLWSADPARQDYVHWMAKTNPASPLNRNAPGAMTRVIVKSVSLLNGGSALVRFETQDGNPAAASQPAQDYTAAISFRFSDGEMPMKDRFINPLGFQVTRYRRDAETIAAPEPAPVPVPSILGAVR